MFNNVAYAARTGTPVQLPLNEVQAESAGCGRRVQRRGRRERREKTYFF
ncbi:MAG: hypothetical protein IMZ44_05905 [Planctomycetes bacterium]|nr:hypothetical protein [Planctomycetota bacterium]